MFWWREFSSDAFCGQQSIQHKRKFEERAQRCYAPTDWLRGTRTEFAGIAAVEDGDAGAAEEVFVEAERVGERRGDQSPGRAGAR
jgi:hypothetical protein